jgi:predicted transcriptional regulator
VQNKKNSEKLQKAGILATRHALPRAENKKNLEKLQKAGILATPHALTRAEKEVIASLSPAEIDVWVNIKEKLDNAGLRQKPVNFFI